MKSHFFEIDFTLLSHLWHVLPNAVPTSFLQHKALHIFLSAALATFTAPLMLARLADSIQIRVMLFVLKNRPKWRLVSLLSLQN